MLLTYLLYRKFIIYCNETFDTSVNSVKKFLFCFVLPFYWYIDQCGLIDLYIKVYCIYTKHGVRNLHEDFRKFRVSEYTNRNPSRKPEINSETRNCNWPELCLIRPA